MYKNTHPKIVILVGPQGSGKSTFAKYFLRTEENWFRVSRDDFRLMQFSTDNLSEEDEALLTKLVDATISNLLLNKRNVIVDATHTRRDYLDQYIEKFNHMADISFKLFDVEKEELERRVAARYKETGRNIPAKILDKFVSQFNHIKATYDFSTRKKVEKINAVRDQDATLPKAIICDLDGTLALLNGRNPFDASTCEEDEPNVPVVNMVKNYKSLGYNIILASGRTDTYKPQTLAWLANHGIDFDHLYMRKEGDFRKDATIKRELFEANIEGKYTIELVLDDRNQVVDLWRNELNLPCFQVFYGDF